MVRYVCAAWALKAFSLTPGTRRLYRLLGNTVGSRRRLRAGLPESYRRRAQRILDLFATYDVPPKGARLLELGTGWVHWEATVLALFYEASFTLFDVWDNRQFAVFKAYASGLRGPLDERSGEDLDVCPAQRERAHALLDAIESMGSFDALYECMGFQYVLERTGALRNLAEGEYDAAFSYNVFEHIPRESVPQYARDLFRVLKPGGYAFLKIDLSDHLSNYDPRAGRKQYLKYSDRTWKLCFENDLQYFNRIQRAEWLALFRSAGLDVVVEDCVREPVLTPVHEQYRALDISELECTAVKVVLRRPPASPSRGPS